MSNQTLIELLAKALKSSNQVMTDLYEARYSVSVPRTPEVFDAIADAQTQLLEVQGRIEKIQNHLVRLSSGLPE